MTVRHDGPGASRTITAMINRRQAVEAALSAWRDAERRLSGANGEDKALRAEISRHRDEYQQLSTDRVIEAGEAGDADMLQARTPELEPTGW